ncbi:hypothetical protein LZ189_17185, partial [Rhodovulum sulfidophilum]|nr:hypothetical protein [Rhodovulum sulfidophilum]
MKPVRKSGTPPLRRLPEPADGLLVSLPRWELVDEIMTPEIVTRPAIIGRVSWQSPARRKAAG